MWGQFRAQWVKERHVKGPLLLPDRRRLKKAVTLREQEQLGLGANALWVCSFAA